MIIDLTKLRSGLVSEVLIDDLCSFNSDYLKQADLLDLRDVHVFGSVYKDAMDDYEVDLQVEGVMVLPCAVTLKPVDYPFQIHIQGNLLDLFEEIDENVKILENSIDLLPIIWENILMEIPMKVVSDEAKDVRLEGNGWKLITEKEEDEEINPELAKLKDLLQ